MSRRKNNTAVIEVEPTDDELQKISQAFERDHPVDDDVDDTEAAMKAVLEDSPADNETTDESLLQTSGRLEELIAAGSERDSKSGRIRQLNRMGVPSATISKILHCRYQQVFVTLKRAGLPNIRTNVKRDEVGLQDDDPTDE